MKNLLERAIEIALIKHKGQIDKAGQPYILHPIRLMLKMQTEEEMIIAVLHDAVEDSDLTFDDLRNEGFTKNIIEALDCVTIRKNVNESYDQFISRILQNKLAIKVKIADLEDNMNILRLKQITEKDVYRLKKYYKYYKILKEKLNELH